MYSKAEITTNGEGFYDITSDIKTEFSELLKSYKSKSGILTLFVMHTSCALSISEAHDPNAVKDVEVFFKKIAPRNLPYITHTEEGEDDSPSHMKSVLLNQSISLIAEEGEIVLGTWQGIYLSEFRDHKHSRNVLLKFTPDL